MILWEGGGCEGLCVGWKCPPPPNDPGGVLGTRGWGGAWNVLPPKKKVMGRGVGGGTYCPRVKHTTR